jgi:hypothetical protein
MRTHSVCVLGAEGAARASVQRKIHERPTWRVTARGPRGADPAPERIPRDGAGDVHITYTV